LGSTTCIGCGRKAAKVDEAIYVDARLPATLLDGVREVVLPKPPAIADSKAASYRCAAV
jgi:hypothetical protein